MMSAKKPFQHPADKLLSILDSETEEGPKEYTLDQIEKLPLAAIKERLHAFGMETAVPAEVSQVLSTTRNGSLGDDTPLDVAQIEAMPLQEVKARLSQTGIDFQAGFEHLQLLIGLEVDDGAGNASNDSELQQEPTMCSQRHGSTAGLGRSVLWSSVVAVALVTLCSGMGVLYAQISELRAVTLLGDGKILETLEKKLDNPAQGLRYDGQNNVGSQRATWHSFPLAVPHIIFSMNGITTPEQFNVGYSGQHRIRPKSTVTSRERELKRNLPPLIQNAALTQ
jgi:hypothetical protein